MKITSIKARNILTFDDQGIDITELPDVALLVGPNGAGKSNLLRVLQLARGDILSPRELQSNYSYKLDSSTSLLIDVGVKLSNHEIQLATTSLLLSLAEEHYSFAPEQRIHTQKAESLIKRVLSAARPALSSLFSDNLHYCLTLSGGAIPEAHSYVEVRQNDKSLYFEGNELRRQVVIDKRNVSWKSFPRVIFDKVLKDYPDALKFPPVQKSRVIPEDYLDGIVAEVKFDNLWRELEPIDGYVPHFQLTPYPDSSSSQRFELISNADLSSLQEYVTANTDVKGGFGAISDFLRDIYRWGLAGLFEERFKLALLGSGHPWISVGGGEIELSVDIPRDLVKMVTATELSQREYLDQVHESFRKLSGVDFTLVKERIPTSTNEGSEKGKFIEVPTIKFREGNFEYSATKAATGHCELLLALLTAVGVSSGVILLDEPAANLHPTKQRDLLSYLATEASKHHNQLIVVTHSPAFIRGEDIATTIRVDRDGGGTRLRRLSDASTVDINEVKKLLLVSPELAGVLFSHRVVLLEGEDETAALPIWFSKCRDPIDFASYGVLFVNVHGQSSFARVSRFLESWGIPHRAIGDGGANEELGKLGGIGRALESKDLTELFREHCPIDFEAACREWRGGEKNPYVARQVAMRTDPPPSVEELWRWLRPFLTSGLA
jgi:hypothetical protein